MLKHEVSYPIKNYELKEALRLLGEDKQTYNLKYKTVEYQLTTLDDGVLDTENAHIQLTTMRGHIYNIRMTYPFGWDDMNQRIVEAYRY